MVTISSTLTVSCNYSLLVLGLGPWEGDGGVLPADS